MGNVYESSQWLSRAKLKAALVRQNMFSCFNSPVLVFWCLVLISATLILWRHVLNINEFCTVLEKTTFHLQDFVAFQLNAYIFHVYCSLSSLLLLLLWKDSSPMDEVGNRCHERLVGALHRYEAKQGGFHGDPVSRNQPCQQPPTSTVTRKELQWKYLLKPNSHKIGREGQGRKFSTELTRKNLLWSQSKCKNMAKLICKHMARQSPAATWTLHADLLKRVPDWLKD